MNNADRDYDEREIYTFEEPPAPDIHYIDPRLLHNTDAAIPFNLPLHPGNRDGFSASLVDSGTAAYQSLPHTIVTNQPAYNTGLPPDDIFQKDNYILNGLISFDGGLPNVRVRD